jgi:hypothetical protein
MIPTAERHIKTPFLTPGRFYVSPVHVNIKNKMKKTSLTAALAALVLLLSVAGCDLFEYGQLGGADVTATFKPGDDTKDEFDEAMRFLSGVWYSHYAGIGRLDGYRIGKWEDFKKLVEESKKIDLFPDAEKKTYTTQTGSDTPGDGDYFVFYDDTVYGESDTGVGGNGGWDSLVTRYIGIVRAVNIFNGDPNRGAIIIEYLEGCAPGWLNRWTESKDGKRPFFGIYYRVLDSDTVQMANAVDLAALYAGKGYYTETATLDGAIELNTVENEAEFIAWGVVIPQDRE